ncbi:MULTISPECIES: hypothetical protein [unclassified Isoptericola]|uniref:hypothetical protein n=1 Tax=unclassified Isoptericola TaxID=2623355 RepID=UPI0036685342
MPTETLPIPTDAAAREALLARVSALPALRHPCVEPVVAVDVRDDGVLAVRRGGSATDLPSVLAVRGRLTSREAAGLLVAVARGLAALHSAGLRQGVMGAEDVVLDPGGTAMLRPRAGDPGPQAAGDDGEAADVHALAALVADLLGDRSDDDATALRAVLAPASAPDPRVRPEAGTLAAQADATVPAEPVRLPEPAALAAAALGRRHVPRAPVAAPESRRRAVRRAGDRANAAPSRASRRLPAGRRATGQGGTRPGGTGRAKGSGAGGKRGEVRHATGPRPGARRVRPVLGALGAVAVAAVLTAVVVQVRPPADAVDRAAAPTVGTTVSATPATTPPGDGATGAADPTQDRDDPAAAAAELTRRRVALLSGAADGAASPVGLADVDVPGSPAHDADAALVDDVRQAGTRVRGAEVTVDEARAQERDDAAAEVVVRYAVGAHEQVAADGTVTAVPATDPRTATLRLTWTPGGWRVAEVA